MQSGFSLSPRYHLDDESPWLIGIDPVRRYWLKVNGDDTVTTVIPGLVAPSLDRFKAAILKFRDMVPGEQINLATFASEPLTIHCITHNVYAVEQSLEGALTWHLFEQEALEQMLMTAHPDWQCARKDLDLGRQLLMQSWQTVAAA
jgi:hypothetical protein